MKRTIGIQIGGDLASVEGARSFVFDRKKEDRPRLKLAALGRPLDSGSSRMISTGIVLAIGWMSALAALAQKPNIVVFLADDLGYGSVGAFGADPNLVRTPHIDQLVDQGMRFSNAYTTGSVCSPTRYAMLTGEYSWRTNMKSGVVNHNAPMLIEPEQTTIASWLQDRGYQTSHFGKWHLGYGLSPSASLLEAMHLGPNALGFDYHFGVPNNMDDRHKVYVENDSIHGLRSHRLSPYGKSFYGQPYMGYDAPQRNEPQVMDELTRKAVDWIEHRDQNKPFFLYFAAVAVHHPIMPSERMRGTSKLGAYGDFIHDLDYSVGQLMEVLEARGIAENTIFIFTSDNGGDIPTNRPESPENQAIAMGLAPNGQLRGDKHTIYNGGFKVPFVVRWPKHIEAATHAHPTVSTLDIFPTIVELLEGTSRGTVRDGRSFATVLRDPESVFDRGPLVLRDAKGRRALVAGDYKFISDQLPKTASSPALQEELYNLRLDPTELNSLLVAEPQRVEEMRRLLAEIAQGD